MHWLRLWWLGLVGAALVVGGGITVAVAQFTPITASFGWYAYAPLAHTTFVPPQTSRTVPTVVGTLLLTAGAVLVAGVIGFRLGVRKARSQ